MKLCTFITHRDSLFLKFLRPSPKTARCALSCLTKIMAETTRISLVSTPREPAWGHLTSTRRVQRCTYARPLQPQRARSRHSRAKSRTSSVDAHDTRHLQRARERAEWTTATRWTALGHRTHQRAPARAAVVVHAVLAHSDERQRISRTPVFSRARHHDYGCTAPRARGESAANVADRGR